MVEIVFSEEEIRRYSARAGLGFNLIVKEAFLFSVKGKVCRSRKGCLDLERKDAFLK